MPAVNQTFPKDHIVLTERYSEREIDAFEAEARISAFELMEGAKAFSDGREYNVVDPFVRRFDEVVSSFIRPATHDYLEYGLAHTIFELWQEDSTLFRPYTSASKRLDRLRIADRSRGHYLQHDRNFANTVARNLKLYDISFPQEAIPNLAAWIWASSERCPALRLGFEVFNKVVRNVGDSGQESDIPDFAHVDCVPYVDAITLDRRMRGYVRQVDESIRTMHSQRVFSDINHVQAALQMANCSGSSCAGVK